MSIEAAFFGFLAADAEARTSKAGKLWVRLRVGVGQDDNLQWVAVACFGRAAEIAGELRKGDRIYCEGTIKLDSWNGSDGAERHGLSVASFKLDKTHQIGRNRPKRENGKRKVSVAGGTAHGGSSAPRGDFHNDPLPFGPEVR